MYHLTCMFHEKLPYNHKGPHLKDSLVYLMRRVIGWVVHNSEHCVAVSQSPKDWPHKVVSVEAHRQTDGWDQNQSINQSITINQSILTNTYEHPSHVRHGW